ncbi:azurin [Achromobacter aegrifaciens]|nr:azurin [Achromobacter aegrifaciens]
MAADCAVEITANDQMQFGAKEISVPKNCKEFSVTLNHTGKMPKTVMGHNWVLTAASDMLGVVTDAMSAGPSNEYLKSGDARIIAATKMLGGGEKDTVKVDMYKLASGNDYAFFCTFPGHSAIMKGRFVLAQ